MSGIIAYTQSTTVGDGGTLIGRLTQAMEFRAPDGLSWEVLGPAAMGHARMITATGEAAPKMPLRLEEAPVWITADARIDAQDALRSALAASGRKVSTQANDAELILHAYLCWGPDCLERLLGDFCFAIWDGRKQELFAARDPFGIKPLFFARLAEGVLVGNTLTALCQHSEVGTTLDEQHMADFLLFGEALDPESTAYAAVRRLRAGHGLTWSANHGLKDWRYWQLPVFEPRHASSHGDEVAEFFDLLKTVVRDRLRTDRVGFELSGGMDSTSLAAMAKLCLNENTGRADMLGISVVFDEWMPDEERHYASLAANHLGLPALFLAAEQFRLFDWPAGARHPPEPWMDLMPGQRHRVLSESAAFGRVWLTGWDGDALMSEPLRPFLAGMARKGQFLGLARAVTSFFHDQGGLWLSGVHQRLQRGRLARKPQETPPGFPEWIHPDLVQKLDLKARWASPPQTWQRFDDTPRPYAYRVLNQMAEDGRAFDRYDAGVHGFTLDYRHPMMDLRLIEHCLRLPLQPWCVKKHILREAMKHHLPQEVTRRPKAPLAASHMPALLQRDMAGVPHWSVAHENLCQFVNYDKLIHIDDWLSHANWRPGLLAWEQAGRPWVLGQWLETRPLNDRPSQTESDHLVPTKMTVQSTPNLPATAPRKAYQAPVIRRFGSISDLTLSRSCAGGSDNANSATTCPPGNPNRTRA